MEFTAHGTIWDFTKNKPLIVFGKEKTLDITDEYIIKKLIEFGYGENIEANTKEYNDFLGNENPFEDIEANTKEYKEFLGDENPFVEKPKKKPTKKKVTK